MKVPLSLCPFPPFMVARFVSVGLFYLVFECVFLINLYMYYMYVCLYNSYQKIIYRQ